MMQWMFAVTAVGLSALVNVCPAEEVEMCSGGNATARNINLTIALIPSTFRCCCHLDFKAAQTVWRRTTVDCGITLVHNVTFLDKNCSENTSFSQTVDQNKTDLCVVRENGLQQNKSLTGHMILEANSHDIDVNCSEPVLMSPSTGSNPPGVSEVKPTTESTPPSTSSGLYIALAVVGGLLMCIGVVCGILVHRRNQNFPVPQETVRDVQGKTYNEDIILHVDMAENQKETNVPAECACEDNENRSGQVINGHFDDVDNTVKNQENIFSESQLTASCNTLKQYIQGNGVSENYYEDIDNTTTNQILISKSQSAASCNTLEQNSQDKGVGGDYEDVDNTTPSSASCNTLEQHSQGKGVGGDCEDIDSTAKSQEDISESQSTASCNILKQRSQNNVVGGDYEDMENTADAKEQPAGPGKVESETCIKDIIQDNAYETISIGEGNRCNFTALPRDHP